MCGGFIWICHPARLLSTAPTFLKMNEHGQNDIGFLTTNTNLFQPGAFFEI